MRPYNPQGLQVLRLAAILLALHSPCDPALAFWEANGVTLSIGTGASTAYTAAMGDMRLVPDGEGGAIAVWANGTAVRVQRVTHDGSLAPGWPANGVVASLGGPQQRFPEAIPDGAGGVIVAWWDTRHFQDRIFAQRVNVYGMRAWSDSGVVISDAGPSECALAPDGSGGAMLVWGIGTVDSFHLAASHVDANGALVPGWKPYGTRVCPQGVHMVAPTIVSDGAGGAFVAWTDSRNAPAREIYVQRLGYDGDISTGWPEAGLIACAAPGDRYAHFSMPDGAGGVTLAWSDNRSPSTSRDIYAQRVSPDGSLASGWELAGMPVCLAPGTQGGGESRPAALTMVSDDAGGALLAWVDARSGGYDIYANRITAEGNVAAGWAVDGIPVCTAYLQQRYPVMARDGNGGAYLAWFDQRGGLDFDVYVTRLSGAGELPAAWPENGLALCTASGDQRPGAMCEDGAGGVIIAWEDFRRGAPEGDIYCARVSADGIVPTLASLIQASADLDQVHLRWWVGGDRRPGDLAVERREVAGDWAHLGIPVEAGSGQVTYDDPDVTPGGRYGYRLTWSADEGGRIAAGETWVDVPQAGLSLTGITPNPTHGTMSVGFSLPDARPARIELIDVSGRLVESNEVGRLGAGRHTVTIGKGSELGPGVYLLRLVREDEKLTARAVVLR